jgi:GMP synthase (glutamine-hydrolysing)
MERNSMNVLIIKNIASEGPGTIEDYLRSGKLRYSITDLNRGEKPPEVNDFTHLVVMGGPMAVYEMDRYPFLKNEAKLIRQAIHANKHVLGVCLGAQMVAHALGAQVYAGEQKEIGWYEAAITPEGMKDPLMRKLALDGKQAAQVFQWHGDTFDLPSGAVRLASSDLFPNQAFLYSDRVYALQFHIEVTPVIVLDWLKDEKAIDLNKVSSESNRIYGAYETRAMNFYREFFK